MTDVPRRSYPLVVPPPGGFEDAVRRGRHRRHRIGGSTAGAALALIGVLAYSIVDTDPTWTGVDATNNPLPTVRPLPGLVAPTPAATPTASPTAQAPAVGGRPVAPGSGRGPDVRPTATADPEVGAPAGPRPTAEPQPRPRPYAKRADIDRRDAELAGNTDCLPNDKPRYWCAYARATKVADSSTAWELEYRLCRSLDAGDGVVTFDRKIEAEFAVTDSRNNDTIWTYSLGVANPATGVDVGVPAGHCRSWTVEWNGLDDYGYTPRPGAYVLTAASTGRSDPNLPTDKQDMQIG